MRNDFYSRRPPSAVWLDPPWLCPPSRATASTLMALTATIQPPSRSWAPARGVSSGTTGALATFGTCASCITGISTTYNPFSAPVNNFLSGTNGAIHFALDLLSVFNVQFVPNNDLDFDGAAVLHLTNFADTPGEIFFSSQGPNDIEVSFSATAVPTVEPAEPSPSWVSACWDWVTSSTGGAVTASIPPQRHNKRGTPHVWELTDRGGVPWPPNARRPGILRNV